MKRKLRQNILAGDGTTYTLCICIVREKKLDGSPRKLEVVGMDESVDLALVKQQQGGACPEFITCYVNKEMMRR